jgi:D-tyrosyl-tRNA(Tyr) deacylase
MRVIIQRVSSASVSVDGEIVGSCGPGLLLLVGIHRDDESGGLKKVADKVSNLRIFNDAEGKMNLSLLDLSESEPGILAVSNFTVYGNAEKSRRPSFSDSAGFEKASTLFEQFVAALKETGIPVATGVFGADMQVSLLNDGPVTLVLDLPTV